VLGDQTHTPTDVSPNSSLWTAHLHPTRRYKNRRNQGEFELPFEFVKDKTWQDSTVIIKMTAMTVLGIDLKKKKKRSPLTLRYSAQVFFFVSFFNSRKPLQPTHPPFFTVSEALWCVKCDACAQCGLSSRNTLHYSFGWQSRGPYPLALPHHNAPLWAAAAVCMPDLDTNVDLL